MRSLFASLAVTALIACSSGQNGAVAQTVDADTVFEVEELAVFSEPWALAPLPDGRLLVTEKAGRMLLWSEGSEPVEIAGITRVAYGGQGGLGDVVLHPDYAENGLVYFSYAEPVREELRGAVVARGRLVLDGEPRLEDVEIVWRQSPRIVSPGHFGHRIAFGPDGLLYISSGERMQQDPAQDLSNTLGTVVRLNDDGSTPESNPFANRGGVTTQIWSYGHRNPLGLAFAPDGRLWELEHGPAGGDELNLIEAGVNYGWPTVSNGSNYDGRPIPAHSTHPEFRAPVISWTPVLAPGNMVFYSGAMFPDWQGDILISGMTTHAIIRVDVNGGGASEAARYDLGQRIRAVMPGVDGAIWALGDEREESRGILFRLTPAS
jgi:glucose/arabinose dehydrogenase